MTSTATINDIITTDNGNELPVVISYQYTKIQDTLGDFGVNVSPDFSYKVLGDVEETPDYIIREQVEELIKAEHYLPVEFE